MTTFFQNTFNDAVVNIIPIIPHFSKIFITGGKSDFTTWKSLRNHTLVMGHTYIYMPIYNII